MMQHAPEIMVVTMVVMTVLSGLGIAAGVWIAQRKERRYLAIFNENNNERD